MQPQRVVLIILDGWGLSPNPAVSAIDQAKKPFFDGLWQKYIHATLNATGTAVGLPVGQMGNSEVGHMNIGAGRVVYQELVRVNEAIRTNEIAMNTTLIRLADNARKSGKRLHLMGLVSDGGVHSHIRHLIGLLEFFDAQGVNNMAVHAFTDGRDCDPKSGLAFVREAKAATERNGAVLASVIGRYYAMDRDKRWERVKIAYDALVKGKGKLTQDPLKAIEDSYAHDVTDEFIMPIVCTNADGHALATIEDGDFVLCFNFRTDRGRQITQALTQQAYPEQDMRPLTLGGYVTLTRYDESFKGIDVVFEKDNLENTLGATLSAAGKRQIRIAETEKYPHVTFFFNGGREEAFPGEERIMCPSPKVATYDLKPEMSAFDIAAQIVPRLRSQEPDFVCLNFANTDMVGHTGVFAAAVKACEAVDAALHQVVDAALQNGYLCWIIADHGNSDNEINPDGSPNTQHSTNPVPSLLVGKGFEQTGPYRVKDGKLGDLAPSILTLMQVPIPAEMRGEILVDLNGA